MNPPPMAKSGTLGKLVKIKVADNAELDRHEAADAIAKQTKSEVAQVLGNTVLLYRADPDEPRITIPPAQAK